MYDHQEFAETNDFDFGRNLLIKWLRMLFVAQIVSLGLSVLGVLQILNGLHKVLTYAVGLSHVMIFFKLSAVSERYRKTFLAIAVQWAATIASLFITNGALSLVTAISSTIALYQQYHAHSEVIAAEDEKLAGKWTSFFYWELAVGLISAGISVAVVMIAVTVGASSDAITQIAVYLVGAVSLALEVIYLRYLRKTLVLLEKTE